LGRALAEAVLAHGDQLVATARRPADLDDLVARYGDRVRAVALDVTDPVAARAAVDATIAAFGRLDVLVNNAGYANAGPIEELAEEDFRAQIETNLWGVINVTRAALPVLHRQRAGHVIQIGSVGGRVTSPGLGAYQTAKWGVEGFSGVLAKEVAPFGVKVTVIEPGGMATDWAGSSMTIHTVSADYEPTVGAMAGMRERMVQSGDPAKAAAAILEVARLDDPPLQLLLGADAWQVAGEADRARRASDERFKELTLSTGAGTRLA